MPVIVTKALTAALAMLIGSGGVIALFLRHQHPGGAVRPWQVEKPHPTLGLHGSSPDCAGGLFGHSHGADDLHQSVLISDRRTSSAWLTTWTCSPTR